MYPLQTHVGVRHRRRRLSVTNTSGSEIQTGMSTRYRHMGVRDSQRQISFLFSTSKNFLFYSFCFFSFCLYASLSIFFLFVILSLCSFCLSRSLFLLLSVRVRSGFFLSFLHFLKFRSVFLSFYVFYCIFLSRHIRSARCGVLFQQKKERNRSKDGGATRATLLLA